MQLVVDPVLALAAIGPALVAVAGSARALAAVRAVGPPPAVTGRVLAMAAAMAVAAAV